MKLLLLIYLLQHTGLSFGKSTDIRECLKEVCNAAQINNDFALRPSAIDLAMAMVTNDGRRAIYYNKDYFDTVTNHTFAIAIVAHEIGHFVHKDFSNKDRAAAEELNADEYAGYILYQLHLDIGQANRLLDENCPLMAAGYYPARSDRKKAMEQGFESAKARSYQNITFDYGTANLTVNGYHALEPMIADMKRLTGKIEIDGFYISDKGAVADLRISAQQALAVKTYLIARGVTNVDIVTKGFGETQPIASNLTPIGRLMNCRIEFKR